LRQSTLLALLFCAPSAPAIEILRLPWIFSDEPELTADFNFSTAAGGLTAVEISLGGRFARFGLRRGSARAPVLDVRLEVISPGELKREVATLKSSIDLSGVLKTYGVAFDPSCFRKSSVYVYKHDFHFQARPGDF